jgi:hypothetical protein
MNELIAQSPSDGNCPAQASSGTTMISPQDPASDKRPCLGMTFAMAKIGATNGPGFLVLDISSIQHHRSIS